VSIGLAVALQLSVSVQVADTVRVGAAVPVVVRATVSGNSAPRTTAPRVDGVALPLEAEQTRIGGGFGQAVATRESRYVWRVQRAGSTVIGAVVATSGPLQAISPARPVTVLPAPANAVPALVRRAPLSRANTVNLHALVTPDTVWAGEQITLQVGVFLDPDLQSRLQRNPEYFAPSVDGAVAYDLPVQNDRLPIRVVDGVTYRPFIFARALFPLVPGGLIIPPARLQYALSGPASTYGKRERAQAVTDSMRVVVRDLPALGRPASFTGAVGVFSLDAAVDRTEARVGDALPLSVTVRGAGNIKMLPAPNVDVERATVTAAGESITVDSSDLLVRGSKTFRLLVTPRDTGLLTLRTIRYGYFNPVTGAYAEAVAALPSVTVRPGGLTDADVMQRTDSAASDVLPLAPWRALPATALQETWWFRVSFAAALLPWLALLWRRLWWRLRPRGARSVPATAGVRPRPQSTTSLTELRQRVVAALADAADLGPAEATDAEHLARRLRRAGVTSETTDAGVALLSRLDRAVFGATTRSDGVSDIGGLAAEWDAVFEQIQRERTGSRQPTMRTRAVRVLLVSLTVGSSAAHAQPTAVGEAQRAYRAAAYDSAAAAFARAAADDPENAVLWANLGAAHWMRADTAGALLAWQRSERLAPNRSAATSLVRQFATDGDWRHALPPLSTSSAWLLLLCVTALCSAGAAFARWRGQRVSGGTLLAGTGVLSALAALVAFTAHARTADGLVLLRSDAAVRAEPVLAGEVIARARAGELATLVDAQGSWRRVTLRGRPAGWVEADAVRALSLVDGREVALQEARVASGSAAP
jgi:tetratricopeptide (TPR) repeat protein